MNFRKLLTYLTVGTAAVIPFAGAQNPTILQGSYISNVFGQSNFILNPNAQTNVANVTTATATVTRSTTTPLVATSEFNVAIGTANGTATWATRAFDQGMKGQNCEARFSYRGFQATSKVQIKQSTNVVASLTLTPATDPRIASINFPCGDLSTATTFVVTDTAILAGTNEIGGIYTGLATNMANVAQAEFVGATELASCTTPHTVTSATFANLSSPTCTRNNFGAATTSTNDFSVTIPNAKPGWYFVKWNGIPYADAGSNISCYWALKEDTQGYVGGATYANSPTGFASAIGASQLTMDLNTTTTATRTFRVVGKSATGACKVDATSAINSTVISVFRFPASSELVVTPERQNTFAAAQWPQSATSYAKIVTGTTTPTAVNAAPFASSFATFFGGGQAVATANDYGLKVSNIPPGTYRVTAVFNLQNNTGSFDCEGQIWDGSNVIAASGSDVQNSFPRQGISNLSGVVRYTSVQSSREFTIRLKPTSATITCTAMQMNGAQIIPSIVFEPLDQPSNSALYVQGPVLAAATGAAIPAGYVFNNFYGSQYSGSYANGAWLSLASTTLSPGLWQVEAACMMRNNTTSATTNWGFAALSLSDNSSDQGTDTNPHSYQYRQPSATLLGQYDFLNAKRIIYTTTTTLRYLNIYSSWLGGGTPTYNCQFFVMRLN